MSNDNRTSIKPETINRLRYAVDSSFAMFAGMKLEVFTPLKDGPMTVEQLAGAIGGSPAKLGPLMHALVLADLVTVENGRFSNAAEADQFLVKGKPAYMGGMHSLLEEIWTSEMNVAESISTGVPQAKLDFSIMSEEELEPLLRGLHSGSVATGRELVAMYDFSSYSTLVDVGGGSGGLALTITEAFPNISATVADLPAVTPITKRVVEENNASDRIDVVSVDARNEPLPRTYDVAVMRSLIQVLSADDAQKVIQNVGRSLNPSGTIHIVGAILDDSRLSPSVAVGMGLFFASVYDDGQSYTEREHRDWLTNAGFEAIERSTIQGGNGVMTARKPV